MSVELDLQHRVLEELEWDPKFDAANVGVAVNGSTVTLNGHVRTYAEKFAAEAATKRVRGVHAVVNGIDVRPLGSLTRDDTDVAQSAVLALTLRHDVPVDAVVVKVSGGWVTLTGEVEWQYQRQAAEDAVRPLLGVRGVTNALTLRPRTHAQDVKQRIESAFRRSAEIDARSIQVDAEDSSVTLRGTVRTWAEREEAEQAAWAAPGVRSVRDELVVGG